MLSNFFMCDLKCVCCFKIFLMISLTSCCSSLLLLDFSGFKTVGCLKRYFILKTQVQKLAMFKMITKFYGLQTLVWFCWNKMNQAEPASNVFHIFIFPILLGVTVFTTLLLPPEFRISSLDRLPLLPDSLQSKPANTEYHQ